MSSIINIFVFIIIEDCLDSIVSFYNRMCFILRIFSKKKKKRAKFPLFLDAPDNTSCRYFSKFNQDSNNISNSSNIS
ncbi:hypothetical protein Hanom_Chr11g01019141 [Helianthus anomalus]